MRKYNIFILSVLLLLLSSCNEDERKFEASPDMLFLTRTSSLIFEVEEGSDKIQTAELGEKIKSLLMIDSVRFPDGYIYEMKLSEDRIFDIYTTEKKYIKGKKYNSGTYTFDQDVLRVTFSVDNLARSFTIDGAFKDVFYNHFVRKSGKGEYQKIDRYKVFCLHDDYTSLIIEKYQEQYPEVKIKLVEIKTDMMTIRPLETFK